MDKPKEVKIKEKWLQKELDDWLRKSEGIRELLKYLGEEAQRVNADSLGVWKEVVRRYNLDSTARHTYEKKTHTVREISRYSDIVAKGYKK